MKVFKYLILYTTKAAFKDGKTSVLKYCYDKLGVIMPNGDLPFKVERPLVLQKQTMEDLYVYASVLGHKKYSCEKNRLFYRSVTLTYNNICSISLSVNFGKLGIAALLYASYKSLA